MRKRLVLPEEKSKKIAIATTVACVIVTVVLVVFLAIQFAWIGTRNAGPRAR